MGFRRVTSGSPFPYELCLVRRALHGGAEGVQVPQQRRIRLRPRFCIPQATASELVSACAKAGPRTGHKRHYTKP